MEKKYVSFGLGNWIIGGVAFLSLMGAGLFFGFREKEVIRPYKEIICSVHNGEGFVSGTPWDSYKCSPGLVLEYISEFKRSQFNHKKVNLFRDGILSCGYNVPKLEKELKLIEATLNHQKVQCDKEEGACWDIAWAVYKEEKIGLWPGGTKIAELKKLILDYLEPKIGK